MSAVLDPILELSRPAEAAGELQALNDRLARERSIPGDVAGAVEAVVEALLDADLRSWHAIDPHHAVIVLRSAMSAQRAARARRSPAARDELRVALESMRQSLAAIAEREPVSDERRPKELVQWLAERTEVSQARLAELLGVSARQLQRWISDAERAQPEGDDARKVRLVAQLVNQLRFSLTPSGTVEWFGWPRGDLGGRCPLDLLGVPAEEPALMAAAAGMRGLSAA